MGDTQTWQQVLKIINRYDTPFVVVSATARTTRQLLEAAQQALENLDEAYTTAEEIRQRHQKLVTNFLGNYPEADNLIAQECNSWIEKRHNELREHLFKIHLEQKLSVQTKDTIASIGERLSSYLFNQCATAAGFPTTWIDAAEIISTDSNFGQASPDLEQINLNATNLMDALEDKKIPIMGGYYGQDENGNITTLGFEGSDYTASLIGAAVSAEAIEIWTDVSGIYTCDPRLISDAKPIPQLSFQEATELAYFGAKVLHPSTTKPASQEQIPVWVKNIFEPDAPGTCISNETASNGRVKAMTFKENCAVITVTSSQTVMGYEFLAGVFDILRWHHLPVDVVTTTEASVSIAIEHGNRIDEAVDQLSKYGSVDVLADQGIISLVGCEKNGAQSLVNDVLEILNGESANIISFSQSKGNLNIVMAKKNVASSVKNIHAQIFR